MRQKYVDHIESIMAQKKRGFVDIYKEWNNKAPLFQICSRGEYNMERGCLTMIKYDPYYSSDFDLTQQIREDGLIPEDPYTLEELLEESSEEKARKILERFAYYQNLIDDLAGIPQ